MTFGHVAGFQKSWQVLYFVDLEVQISWPVQYIVDLKVQIVWQVQYFVEHGSKLSFPALTAVLS